MDYSDRAPRLKQGWAVREFDVLGIHDNDDSGVRAYQADKLAGDGSGHSYYVIRRSQFLTHREWDI